MMEVVQYINDLYLDELESIITKASYPRFRANQIFKWIHQKGIERPEEMTNISPELKGFLKESFSFVKVKIEEKLTSRIDNTKKYLISFNDGNVIESVAMEYHHGVTACISSQIGCRMGCSFCASTIGGLVRNLTPGEIEAQVQLLQKDINRRISNIVIMGSGEPLDNFDNIVKFLSLINDKNGLNVGYRHITLSTCGLVPQIYRLADLKLPVTLAISLHSPNDELRREIMPVAKNYKIEEIVKASQYYIESTGRRVTMEYALINGVNNSIGHANELAKILKGNLFHVNLIPVNNVNESGYDKPSAEDIEGFKRVLEVSGLQVTQRRELGSDINAACGQLRKSFIANKSIDSK